MLPDLESLRCFEAAASTLSFRGAARRVGLSPAAFSERIRRLENAFEVRLFDRTTRSVALTAAGTRLLPQARRALEEAALCVPVAREGSKDLPVELVVGTRFELGLSWLTPSLTSLRERAPHRTVHLYMGDTPALEERLMRGELDAVVFSARLTRAGLDYVTLHAEDYVFVGAGPVVTEPGGVEGQVLLDVSADLPLFRYLLDALPGVTQWPFQRREYLGGIGALRLRALEGAGVAVLPHYYVRDDLAAGRLVRLLPDVSLQADAFRLVWRQGHAHAAALQALAEDLRDLPLH
jgi:LysR family transcriptional regulator, glycine cleavage system transcriptional activator